MTFVYIVVIIFVYRYQSSLTKEKDYNVNYQFFSLKEIKVVSVLPSLYLVLCDYLCSCTLSCCFFSCVCWQVSPVCPIHVYQCLCICSSCVHVLNFQLNVMLFAVSCVLCHDLWLMSKLIHAVLTMCLSTITFSLLFTVDSS